VHGSGPRVPHAARWRLQAGALVAMMGCHVLNELLMERSCHGLIEPDQKKLIAIFGLVRWSELMRSGNPSRP
jgi:hypothetical protein